MPQQPRSRLVLLGVTRDGESVPLELELGREVGLVLVGERPAALAVARSLMVQLASQGSAPVLLRADDRITVDGVPVVALITAAAGRPPPNGETPRLTIDDVPWARLDADSTVRLRCQLTSRAEFAALLEAARTSAREVRGRHARADENGGIFATSALIS